MADLTTETTEQRRNRERDLLALLFLLCLTDLHEHLSAQCALYLAGGMSIHRLTARLTAALIGAHAQACWLGRRLAGASAPMGEADTRFAQYALQQQSRYLTGLVNDLARGKDVQAADAVDTISAALSSRLLQWARRTRGTAEEAWALSLAPGTLVNWQTTAEESCTDCETLHAQNPHPRVTLDKFPGSGQTECRLGCRCYLETVGGERCFEL